MEDTIQLIAQGMDLDHSNSVFIVTTTDNIRWFYDLVDNGKRVAPTIVIEHFEAGATSMVKLFCRGEIMMKRVDFVNREPNWFSINKEISRFYQIIRSPRTTEAGVPYIKAEVYELSDDVLDQVIDAYEREDYENAVKMGY